MEAPSPRPCERTTGSSTSIVKGDDESSRGHRNDRGQAPDLAGEGRRPDRLPVVGGRTRGLGYRRGERHVLPGDRDARHQHHRAQSAPASPSATCSNAMLANAVGPALLKHGKKWYFLIADYAFGTDARDRLKKILFAQGGQVVGEDLHPLAQTEYSSYMTKARNTDADVMVFCNYGPDCQNAAKAAVQLGLNKKMKFGGILCGNDVAVGHAGRRHGRLAVGLRLGTRSRRRAPTQIYNVLKPLAKGPVNWRQYLGYMAANNIIDRLNAPARPTPRSSSRRSRTQIRLRQEGRRVLPQVRPSSRAADLCRNDRGQEQAAQRRSEYFTHRLDGRRRLRGRVVLEPRQHRGPEDHRLGEDRQPRRLHGSEGLSPVPGTPLRRRSRGFALIV